MSTLYPGCLVECIHEPVINRPGCTGPKLGSIYRVRDIRMGRIAPRHPRKLGVTLEEIRNPEAPNGLEYSFSADCFRPLDNDTGFDFRDMLEPAPRELECM